MGSEMLFLELETIELIDFDLGHPVINNDDDDNV